ncbi:MAG: efflux RND transporter periplasmic adaptor subunit [Candidatus Korobacteraceae bacterium]
MSEDRYPRTAANAVGRSYFSLTRKGASFPSFLEFLVPIFAAAVLAGCGATSAKSAGKGSDGQPQRVSVVRPQSVVFERTVGATGSLLADEEAQISLKVSGRIQAFHSDIGSCVAQGTVLARLEPQDLELRVQQAEAALEQAEARLGISPGGDVKGLNPEQTATARQAKAVLEEARLRRDRTQELHDQGIISKAELDSAMASFGVAEAQYQQALEEVLNRRAIVLQRRSEVAIARQDFQDAMVRAPVGGCVQQKIANVGEYLNEGAPVLSLVRMDPLRLRLQVAERDASVVRPGQSLRFVVEGDPTRHEATVKRMSPAITPEGRMVIVESEVKYQPGLRPGSFARAEIVVQKEDPALAVPEKSLTSFAGIDKILVVDGGKAVERQVQLGRRKDGMVEVLSGVTRDLSVISTPANINVGQPVTPES